MKRTKLLIIFVVVIVLVLVLLRLTRTGQDTVTGPTTPSPIAPSPTLLPSPRPTAIPTSANFEVLSVAPPPGKQSLLSDTFAIAFIFTQPIDPTSVRISSSPTVNIKTSVDPKKANVLYISPEKNWTFNQEYRISLSAISVRGGKIQNYLHIFTPLKAEASDFGGE